MGISNDGLLQFDGMGFVRDSNDFLIVVQTFHFTFQWNIVFVDIGIEHSLWEKRRMSEIQIDGGIYFVGRFPSDLGIGKDCVVFQEKGFGMYFPNWKVKEIEEVSFVKKKLSDFEGNLRTAFDG